jgi:tetraacyldisaccharide-1-P 4'-kinase
MTIEKDLHSRSDATHFHAPCSGDIAVSPKSLTIVLPVHNAELRLRNNVREVLELASELTPKFDVLIIDDGSTDSTFEVAEELATLFPQVSVRRNRYCRGLGETLQYVQRRVRSDAVMVHDGVTPIDQREIRMLWRQWIVSAAHESASATDGARQGAIDFAAIADMRSIHESMERAHARITGFQMLSLPEHGKTFIDSLPELHVLPEPARTDAPHASRRSDRDVLGQIPRLPRPKFLSALAAFALGE